MCKVSFFIFGIVLLSVSGLSQVAIPAAILNSSGASIHGLEKPNFLVSPSKAASFDAVEEVPPLSFSGFGEPIPVFVLFDAASIPPPVQGQTAKKLLNYLRKAADQRLAVTVLVNSDKGLELAHDMSTDMTVFVSAMDRVMPGPKNSASDTGSSTQSEEFSKAVAQEVQQLQILTKTTPFASSYKTTMAERQSPAFEEDARRALEKREMESLRQVGEIFKRSRKRKLLIWLTGYFPMNVANGELTYGNYVMPYGRTRPKIRPEMTALYERAVESLNNARLTVYPAFVADARNYNVEVLAKDTLDGLDELARRTGGKMLGILDSLDFDSAIADLKKHFDSYYILSFILQSTRKDSWIDSNIKVNKAEVKIAAPKGFFAEP